MQEKHEQWVYQWENLEDNSLFLFKEWISPYRLEDFKDKRTPGICINCGKTTGKAAQAKRCEPCRKRYHNWSKAKSQAKYYWGKKGTTS